MKCFKKQIKYLTINKYLFTYKHVLLQHKLKFENEILLNTFTHKRIYMNFFYLLLLCLYNTSGIK